MQMESIEFEGFTGMHLNNASLSSDILLLVVILLLSAFALIFRLNVPVFGKMINHIHGGEQRPSIFDSTERDRFLFNAFMTFQTLLLCAIFLFSIAVEYQYILRPDIWTTLRATLIIWFVLLLFYLFKILIISLYGRIFADKSAYKMIFMNYQRIFCLWGIILYFPVLWVLLIGRYFFFALMVFIISYLVSRIILILRFVHIFFNKNNGKLFLITYLCGQEIIPLVFLYEGLILIYRIIGIDNVWQ